MEVKKYLDQTWSVLEKAEKNFHNQPILKSNDPIKVKNGIKTSFPEKEQTFETVLEDFESEILPWLNRNTDTRFGAYITGSGNKVAALAEFIKAYFNQNGLKWNNSPIASELEQIVLKWVAEYVGLPDFSKGVLTSGGSMSNLMSIHFALADRFPNREMNGFYGEKPFTIYCSNQTHSSIDRAMVFLGLGRDYLRKINVNEQFEIDLNQLRTSIEEDLENDLNPLMIIGNAGTTNTGSIDDLNALADLAEEFGLWFHVDGAYGLPARRLPNLKEAFNGVERADSVIINPHKWMYVTFEASCVLLKSIPEAIHFSPDYLFTENPGVRWESSSHTIELSKEFRALKIWFTMKYYGASQLEQFVKQDIDQISLLGTLLAQEDNIQVEPHHPLSILCFRWFDQGKTKEENEQINIQAIRMIETEGEIFITGTKLRGETYLRVYFGNPDRKDSDVEFMKNQIMDTFQRILTH